MPIRQLPPLIAAFVATSVIFAAVLALDISERKRASQHQRLEVTEQVASLRARLESALSRTTAATHSMAALYTIHPDLAHDEFIEMAQQIVNLNPAIDNITLTRGSVVRYVYPQTGNVRTAVDQDVRRIASLWPDFIRMVNTRATIISTPTQAGRDSAPLFVHNPAFRRSALSGEFIGAIGSPLRLDRLLREAGLDEIEPLLQIAIRRPGNGVFYGDPVVFSASPVIQTIELPGGDWEIAARPREGWSSTSPSLVTIRALGAALCLLTAILTYALIMHLQRLSLSESRLNVSENQLKQRTAELTHQNAVLEMITHNAELSDILEMLALLVEVHHPDMLCSILLLDPDGLHLRHGAAPNLPDFYNRAVDGLAIGNGVGCCGTAAFTGERVIVEDIQQHAYWKDFCALARQADLRSCWSQPIKDSRERIVGTFAIYHRYPARPGAAEIMLIEHYAALAALAIERTHSADALRLHDAALNFAANAIVITDVQARLVWANHAFTKLTGYAFEELIGKQLSKLLNSGHQDSAFYKTLWQTILSGNSWHGELINRRKDGTLYNDETSITPVLDQNNKITHFVAIKQDISTRKQQEEQLKSLAFHDPLTKLPNRRLLLDRLGQALASSKRNGHHGALMFLDLDNFKPLNDEYGHDTGDLLLAEAASRIVACVRAEDTVARFGGDEFVVLLNNLDTDRTTSTAHANAIAEKIRTTLAEPYRLRLLQAQDGLDEIQHHCTSSIGIALFNGACDNAEEIIRQADVAMYAAKSSGRDSIRFQAPCDT